MDEQTATLVKMALMSVLLPMVISALKNPKWSNDLKKYFALAFTLITSATILFVENKLSPTNIMFSVALIIVASHGNYKLWFEKTSFQEWLTNNVNAPTKDLGETKSLTEGKKETESNCCD